MVPIRERSGLAVFLLSAGTAGWNAGNVGPVVAPLSDEFSVSLAAVGLLAGTYFFAGIVAADLAGSAWARRIPIAPALRGCCLLCFGGNLLFALSPEFAGLVAGRVLVGVGAGIALLFGAAFAREAGGVRTLGLFGRRDHPRRRRAPGARQHPGGRRSRLAGWVRGLRGDGAHCAAAHPWRGAAPAAPPGAAQGLLREALTSTVWWRLELLAISVLTIPLVIGAWLVGYLSGGDEMSTAGAGGFGFALFGISAVIRDLGGRLSAAGVSPKLLAVGGLLLAAAGLVVLAESRSVIAACAVVLLTGVGFSLPYPLFYDGGERVLPDRPLAGLGLLQVGSNAFPIVAIPLIGEALSDGRAGARLPLAGGAGRRHGVGQPRAGPRGAGRRAVNPPSARPG
jgi:hypothetical protein